MLPKILQALRLTLFSIVLFLTLFVAGIRADDFSLGDNDDNSLELVRETMDEKHNSESDNIAIDQMNMKELFGDDQVFPFAAGLDSY